MDDTCPHIHATEETVRDQLMQLGERLDQMFNAFDPDRGTGFMLMVSYGEQGSIVSNMSACDLKAALKVQLARLEGQPFQYGHA